VGMTGELISVSDENIERMLKDPPQVYRVVCPDDPRAYEEARHEADKPSLLGRIFGRRPGLNSAVDLELTRNEGNSCFLDKAWHGLHYLLTGTAWKGKPPLNFILAGGRQVGRYVETYRVLTAAEVAAADEALGGLSDEELRNRFRPKDMLKQDIYPEIWNRNPADDDALGYLMEYAADLRKFLRTVAGHHLGLLVSIG